MSDIKKFFEESINFNWEMLESNKNYFIETNSMTDFQKLEELYDMYVYFLEKNEFEKCAVIQTNITEIRSAYHKVIDERKRK